MSDQNRIRLIASQPIRGNILDRDGNVLANSKLNYSLIIKPEFIDKNNLETIFARLAKLLNISELELLDRYDNGKEIFQKISR